MLTLWIAFALIAAVGAGCFYGLGWSGGMSLTSGMIVGLIFQIGSGFYFRKKIMNSMRIMQSQLGTAAEQLRKKYEMLSQRGGNLRALMAQAEKEQHLIFEDAIEYTKTLEPFCKWSLFLNRQLNSIRMQFYFQMKNFAEVDKLMPSIMIAEPVAATMKMTRQYQNGDLKGLDASFKKYAKKFKTNSAMIYALMAWIRLKQDRVDDAIKILIDGKTQTANETLSHNWDMLVNGKIKQFSNAPFGEAWYVLQLEEPKQMSKVPAHAPAVHPAHRQMMAGGGRGMRRH